MTYRAVFLDRDGTINEEVGYLGDPDKLVLIPGSAYALKRLKEAGFKLIVVSNQSGAERGFFTVEDVEKVNQRLIELLSKEGVFLDAIYYCPRLDCDCRKPNTGMIKKAQKEHKVDPRTSYVIGDKVTDMKLAKNAGAVGIMVMTGFGSAEKNRIEADFAPAYYAHDIGDAVRWILEREKSSSRGEMP